MYDSGMQMNACQDFYQTFKWIRFKKTLQIANIFIVKMGTWNKSKTWLALLNTYSVFPYKLRSNLSDCNSLEVQKMTAWALWKALHRMSRVTVLGTATELQSLLVSVAFFASFTRPIHLLCPKFWLSNSSSDVSNQSS